LLSDLTWRHASSIRISSDINIAMSKAVSTTSEPAADGFHEPNGEVVLPQGWKYSPIYLGKLKLPWFASPPTQLAIVSFVCFLCPGMFNALTGMGGGGQVDPQAADDANTALYSTFAVVGFFAGSFANVLGLRITMFLGGLGYSVYVSAILLSTGLLRVQVASFLSYNHNQNRGFTTFAGALLGVCAGLLWTAQGTIMMSYPPEGSKGRYVSWFWMIFNLGAVIGSLVGGITYTSDVLTSIDFPKPKHQFCK
jgi:MFS family permease